MREVLPNQLWIGHAADARDVQTLLNLEIRAVVCLALEEPQQQFPRDRIFCRLPLLDGSGNNPSLLQMAVELVVHLLSEEIPTFIYCGAGMSRSPAITAAALAIVRQQPPDTALRELTSGFAHDVSPALWRDLKKVCGEREPRI